MTFADKLIRLRKINGMSQEDLADELGVSRQAISKWEGMLSVPDLQNVLKISELFGVTTDYLLKDSIGEDGKYPADIAVRAEKTDRSADAPETSADNAEKDDACAESGKAESVTGRAEAAFDNAAEGHNNRAFAIAAGIFLLATPVATLLELFFGGATAIRGGLYAVFTIISLLAVTAAGILAILSAKNKKLAGAAFCLILVQSVASVANSVLKTSDDFSAILNLAGGVINTAFAVLAVTHFYSKHKVAAMKYALLALPSVGAIYSVVVKALFYDYSGNSATTMAFGFGYVGFLLLAAIMFRENGYEEKRSALYGLTAVTLLVIAVALSVFYLLVSLVMMPAGEVVTALYVYGYVALYVAGFALLPWIAYYTFHKPTGQEIPGGYVNIARHILLTGFTALVWHYIWVYSASEYLNGYRQGKKSKASAQLIKYIFVPFYYIYWFNKHGQEISAIEKKRGEQMGKLHAGMMIFACIAPFVASVVMQERINTIVCAGVHEDCGAGENAPAA